MWRESSLLESALHEPSALAGERGASARRGAVRRRGRRAPVSERLQQGDSYQQYTSNYSSTGARYPLRATARPPLRSTNPRATRTPDQPPDARPEKTCDEGGGDSAAWRTLRATCRSTSCEKARESVGEGGRGRGTAKPTLRDITAFGDVGAAERRAQDRMSTLAAHERRFRVLCFRLGCLRRPFRI